jgi:mannosyltransferase OCH1-like enzyme
MIENIVHQIWVGDSNKATWNMMKSWQRYCEKFQWTYKLWRESDIESIHLKNKKLYDYYKKNNDYHGMSDVARIEIINKYGGIYSDCDFFCWENYIPNLINCDHDMLMATTEHLYPEWTIRKFINYVAFDGNLPAAFHLSNGFFMAKKDNNILSYMVDTMQESFDINTNLSDENQNPIKHGTVQKNGCFLLTQCAKKYPFIMIPVYMLFQCYFQTRKNISMQNKIIATYINDHQYDNVL